MLISDSKKKTFLMHFFYLNLSNFSNVKVAKNKAKCIDWITLGFNQILEILYLFTQVQHDESSVKELLTEAAIFVLYQHGLASRVSRTGGVDGGSPANKLEYMTKVVIQKAVEVSLKVLAKSKNNNMSTASFPTGT